MTSQSGADLPPTLMSLSRAERGGSLVFCPDIGGNVFYARPLVQGLAPHVSCYGLRLSPAITDQLQALAISDIAARFAADIAAADLPRPLHLLGFSFGAYFAQETARHLAGIGASADHLWLLDKSAPRAGIWPDLQRDPLGQTAEIAKFLVKNRFGLSRRADVLHRFGFMRVDLGRHPDSYRDIIRHLYAALSDHRPTVAPGPATIVTAAGNRRLRHIPPDLGWSALIDGPVTATDVPGDHLSMLRDAQNAAHITALLQARLTSQ